MTILYLLNKIHLQTHPSHFDIPRLQSLFVSPADTAKSLKFFGCVRSHASPLSTTFPPLPRPPCPPPRPPERDPSTPPRPRILVGTELPVLLVIVSQVPSATQPLFIMNR
jgi:hypothetical protein